MRLIAGPGIGLAPLRGRLNFPGHSVTLIAKLKLLLAPGDTATVCTEEASLPTGDEPYPDDETGQGAPRYESDFAYFKPAADVMVVGSYHAPSGKPVRAGEVALSVNKRTLKLAVVGKRVWHGRGSLPGANASEPFTSLPLRWEHAYGGPGHLLNPVGKGFVGRRERLRDLLRSRNFDRDPLELPRIESIDHPLSFLDQEVEPVGLGPRGRNWPVRRELVGTCDERWLKKRWPWFPEDFDARYFQAAPRGLQIEKYLTGDEDLRFVNMHPSVSDYRTTLPGIRMLAAVQRVADGAVTGTETIPMHLDTLWVDLDLGIAQLVWRGSCVTNDADASDIGHAWAEYEPLSRASAPSDVIAQCNQAIADEAARWEMAPETPPEAPESPLPESPPPEQPDLELAALLDSLPKPIESPLPELTPEQKAQHEQAAAKALAELEAQLKAQEDEEAKKAPPPWTRERVRATCAQQGSLAGLDLSGLDLSGEDLSGADCTSTLLSGAKLVGTLLRKANLSGASLAAADLTEADLSEAQLTEADLSRSKGARLHLNKAQLERANLSEIDWSELLLEESNLAEVHAQGARFTKAHFLASKLDEGNFEGAMFATSTFEQVSAQGTRFVKAELTELQVRDSDLCESDFSEATLARAVVVRSKLHDVMLEQASAPGISLTQCSAPKLRAEASDLSDSTWDHVECPESMFESASLSRAVYAVCALSDSDFTGATLDQASLSGCDLKKAKFTRADLSDASLRGSDCFEGSFEGARLLRTNGTGTSFFRAEFLDAQIEGFHGKDRDLLGTKLAPTR